MRAVVLDLFSTLVPGGTHAARTASARAMGAALGIDPGAFAEKYHENWQRRFRGEFGDLRQSVRAIAALAVPSSRPTEAAVEQAARIRMDLMRRWLVPTAHALSTLHTLRRRGWLLGLLSNCSKETEEVFAQSPLAQGRFDAVALSSAIGAAKPEPEAYEKVAEMLGVATSQCIFVGDGVDGELPGAAAVGARPIQVTEFALVDGPRPPWGGESIATLIDLPALIGHPSPVP